MTNRWDLAITELDAHPRRWLVTGGAGFIGSHLVQWLLEHRQHVRVLDDFSTGTRANLDDVRARVDGDAWARCEIVMGDIRDSATCRLAAEDRDFVLHQAALGSVPRSLQHPAGTHAVNVDGTVNVLLAARDCGVQSVVFASSSSVYGDDSSPAKREDTIGRPLSPYAVSKRVGEIYAESYHRVFALRTVALRYFNVVGPRQSPAGPYAAVVPRWIAALATGERPVVFGDGATSRDFCPVANVVQANVLAALAGDDAMGRAFNVALGQRTTLLELFAILKAEMVNRGAPCARVEPVHESFRGGDVRHSLADVRMARESLGYEPRVDLAEGLAFALDGGGRT
jgi:UDP-N-acetylglucosamine 4-epimerase